MNNNQQFTYVLTDSSITIIIDNVPYTIKSTAPSFAKVKDIVKRGDAGTKYKQLLLDLLNHKKAVQKFLNNAIEISADNVLTYKGKVIANVLVTKILRMLDEGFDINPMLHFLINLEKNPLESAKQELILFMEANDMPLTPDGCITAYKAVNSDYKDYHSGKFDNSVGQICSMPREEVNAKRDVTCSRGLHFAAKEYAGSFGSTGGHLMILKINPADVVSIPYDYNNQKGRCCRYEVIGEVPLAKEGKDDYNTKAVHGATKTSTIQNCPHCSAILDEDDLEQGYCWDCRKDI